MTIPVKAVIFDFGNVLCFPPSEHQYERAARECGVPIADFVRVFWLHRILYDAGELGPREYWNKIAADTGRTFDDRLIERMVRYEIEFWSRFDERVLAWATQLRTGGFRTGMLSNLSSPLGDGLRAAPGFLDHFDHVTLSYELRIVKPQREIYEYSCRGLGIAPDEALFLDDRPENVEGALAAGLNAVTFSSWENFLAKDLPRFALPVPNAI